MEENTTDASQVANQTAESSTAQPESAATDTQNETVPKKDFNKVYWQKKELERKLQAVEEERQNQSVQQTLSPQEEKKEEAPQLEDFDYDQEEYTKALIDYQVKQQVSRSLTQDRQQQERIRQQEEERKLNQSFNERYSDYISNNPEYRELAEQFGGKVYNNTVNQAIFHDENGPAVDHYLLKNPDVAERINNMNSIRATIEIGKISADISKKLQPKTTQAPKPFDTVSGGAGAVASDVRYDPNVSMKDYYNAANARRSKGG